MGEWVQYANLQQYAKSSKNHHPASLPTQIVCATMSSSTQHEENKVQEALALLRNHPQMKVTEACRHTRAAYHRGIRRQKGIPATNTRGHGEDTTRSF